MGKRRVELKILDKNTSKPALKDGLFIGWGLDTNEGYGSWTVAIIENNDGSIELFHPSDIRFINPSSSEIPNNSPFMPSLEEIESYLREATDFFDGTATVARVIHDWLKERASK
jgi:hypothetical protein